MKSRAGSACHVGRWNAWRNVASYLSFALDFALFAFPQMLYKHWWTSKGGRSIIRQARNRWRGKDQHHAI